MYICKKYFYTVYFIKGTFSYLDYNIQNSSCYNTKSYHEYFVINLLVYFYVYIDSSITCIFLMNLDVIQCLSLLSLMNQSLTINSSCDDSLNLLCWFLWISLMFIFIHNSPYASSLDFYILLIIVTILLDVTILVMFQWFYFFIFLFSELTSESLVPLILLSHFTF